LAVAIISFVPANLTDKLILAAIPAGLSLCAYVAGRVSRKVAIRLDDEDRADELEDRMADWYDLWVYYPRPADEALDLRDPSWDGIEQRLAEGGAARVDDESGTAGWAYLRFRELEYTKPELADISSRLGRLETRGVETFAYFRHGDEPAAPLSALAVARVGTQ
jgi:hypothetical protein